MATARPIGPPSLEPSADEFAMMLDEVATFAQRVMRRDRASRASMMDGADELARRLEEGAPSPATLRELLATLEAAAGVGFNQLHPGFLGYVPPVGLPIGAIADFVAALQSRYIGLRRPSPALVQLEWNALRWIADVYGLPSSTRGVFTSGGSLATFTAMVAARHAALGSNSAQGAIYLTGETHHAAKRAALAMGFEPARLRVVPTDGELAMDPASLAAMIRADAAVGLRPFLVVVNAGTVNTGAVDPIGPVVDVARHHGLWVHADAAYGGFFVLTARGRDALAGLDAVDSLAVDPHKGMLFAPGIGCVLVREGGALAAAHTSEGAYLDDLADGASLDFADYSLELTRPMRGLRVWMALKLYGWVPFREALENDLTLAMRLWEALREDPRLEVPWRPRLSTVAFRPRGGSDERTRAMLDVINGSGEVLLSSTAAPDRHGVRRTWLRACFMSHRTTADVVDDVVRLVARALAATA
jgi:aromatic-L-amino-acid decarboxylase